MTSQRKRFGQHFLEPAWAAKLTAAIAPQADETFLEIGPGRGALTIPLASRAKHVVGFEIDRDLACTLREAQHPRITIVEGDFLDVSAERVKQLLAATGATSIRAAGNLPYNVASPILFKLVDLVASGIRIADATVMLQREVADRLIASPGTKDYGVLSILIGHVASVERLLALPPGAFRPPPTIRSAVVRLGFHTPEPPPRDAAGFRAMVQAIFTRRRKTIANALEAFPPSKALPPAKALIELGLDGKKRPEDLTISELVRLADAFSEPHYRLQPRPPRQTL